MPDAISVLAGILALAFFYHQYLDFTRDVPPEYLNEQSIIDTIRNPNELAIYKSTKLDYSSGLRVGLAIRYDHYKLRNGNLCDVWELFLSGLSAEKTIFVGSTSVKVAVFNHQVHRFGEFVRGEAEFGVPLLLLVVSPEILAAMVACFVNQVTVHIYDENVCTLADDVLRLGSDCIWRGDAVVGNFAEIVGEDREQYDFTNVYDFAKDKGIAVRLSTRLNHKVVAHTDFTQLNLISAVASCLKHLPPGSELTSEDKIVVVQNNESAESITNGLVKVLVAFVARADLLLVFDSMDYMALGPTVVSVLQKHLKKITESEAITLPTRSLLEKLLFRHRRFSLSRLRFSLLTFNKIYPGLRLVYIHRPISTPGKDWNFLRALLCTHVVEELGYYNVAGPIVTTEVYDFRKSPDCVGRGCVVQANEMKLVNYTGGPGDVHVRGYNIGKATTTMVKVGDKTVVPDSDGFFQLSGVKARWGTDGCLYIVA